MNPESIWLDVAASVQGQVEDEAVSEAFEVYQAELARVRLADRVGDVQITLVGGRVLDGRLVGGSRIHDHLVLSMDPMTSAAVRTDAVLFVRGSRARLHPDDEEDPQRLTMWLRDLGYLPIRLLLADGSTLEGILRSVAADHVELEMRGRGEEWAVPLSAVDAWLVADG